MWTFRSHTSIRSVSRIFVSAVRLVQFTHPAILPLTTVDIERVLKNDTKRHILDYASDSSSDEDMPTVSNTWKGADMDGSDNESVDSLNDDVLK